MKVFEKIIDKALIPILNSIKKHYWKWILIILASAIAFSGYTIDCGRGKKIDKKNILERKK